MTRKNGATGRNFRFFLIQSVVVLSFLTLTARLVYLQAFMRTELHARVERQVPDPVRPSSLRYSILDRNGLPLAETVQVYSCYVDPSRVDDVDRTASDLARILGLSAKALAREIRQRRGAFMWVKRDVPAALVSKIRGERIDGVGFKLEYRRHYPLGPIAPHVIGLVGIDGHGLSGIEQRFNDVLSGTKADDDPSAPAAGHVRLTIDGWIQQVVERELDWAAKKTGAKKGMVVLQNPNDGEILALATWPPISLDPDNPPSPGDLRIPPISDVFEPGSTFKIVAAAAALEEGVARREQKFDTEDGAWRVYKTTIHDHEKYDELTFDDIIVYSSNIGTAKIAELLGDERLYQYARLFGFGVYPGSGLPGEAKGVLRTPARWSGLSKYIVSFGQEVGVTAIQMVSAYSAIANGGVLMEPQIVDGFVNDEMRVMWENSPTTVRRVVSQRTAANVTDILAQVVVRGSGRNAGIQWSDSVKVAGKTGTAQKFDVEEGRYSDDRTLVSFCGFFPVSDPRVAMIVILDEPEGRRWGGVDAAPVFRRIAEQLTTHILL